jgi:hypothetical protein
MLIVNSGVFGGPGGTPFRESSQGITGIERIKIYYGQLVDRLEVTYTLRDGERLLRAYGGDHAAENSEIIFADDERLCGISIRSGEFVDSLSFITYRIFGLAGMRKYGPFGGPGGENCTILSPNIREFFGRAGIFLDAIGIRCEEPMVVC